MSLHRKDIWQIWRNTFGKFCVKGRSNRLTLCMLVRNESGRYLDRVLKSTAEIIDEAVIVDDASTDGTLEKIQALRDEP